ncbi:MAG TPA: bifunctional sulfate adenylyltransferase/adenylylsulfate kinase [Acidimicrobiales bacterium]|nr:bifunctional sulfate adenylyltransferase/adenylylsulfate kinase [Acidimicrobiales bacterium]
MPDQLISPHGGSLVDLVVSPSRAGELKEQSSTWPSWDLTPRQLCDLELLANGGFSPLSGFMGQEDYESVCDRVRLADGTLWPMPITLDLPEERASELAVGSSLALRDPEGVMLAAIHISEIYRPDREHEAKAVFGTTDKAHPGVAYLLDKSGPVYVAGQLEVIHLPSHYDYKALRLTPAQQREQFKAHGWSKVVAFQTRNPMHRAHVELTLRAARQVEANLLIHPSVGMTKPGDVDHHTRVRCYEAVMKGYPHATAALSLLPLAMRMGGPREAVWHAIIRKNYGATHFIVGRDHAGPGKDSTGQPFYGPYDAQALLTEHSEELGIGVVPFQQMVYVEDRDEYMPVDEVPEGTRTLDISGTELRRRLAEGREIPSWFTYPEVAAELRRSYPPRSHQGVTIFFTGLSGSGKSTIASILLTKLLEEGGRPVTLLDGDLVRKHLSSELGFSKEHRDINIRRIGWVASEITKNGGIAICAPIAPYESVRKEVRSMIEPVGGFLLVHVSTALEVCEQRDRKGLYAKARAGIVKEFTGISDPYEAPTDAEVVIDTQDVSAEAAAQQIILHLQSEGYLGR